MGAMLGAAYGQVLHHVAPGVAGPAGAYALIGMGAVFAGAARAPITAVVILFELTGEYTIILPLMAAIALATGISHLLSADTIYTLKLRRRGVDLDHSLSSAALALVLVEAVMEPVMSKLDDDALMLEAGRQLSRVPHGQLPVVDRHGRYRGIVTARAVAEALSDGAHDNAAIATILELPVTVVVTDPLNSALETLETAYGPIPVTDAARENIVGWLAHQDVLTALRKAGAT
jgi:CIC family chloride channel protein